MKLVIKASTPPPQKQYWHHHDARIRGEWSSIFEMVTNWFCTSHAFNHHHDLIIILDDISIELVGAELRYLGPSLRSAASLLFKAYQVGGQLASGEKRESTPGIYVHHGFPDRIDFPTPHVSITLCDYPSNPPITAGTVFTFTREDVAEWCIPASRLSQAVVWMVQEMR